MVVAVKTEKLNVGDLVRHEYEPFNGYARDKVTVYNETGYDIVVDNPLAQPIMVSGAHAGAYKFVAAGSEASAKGLVLRTDSLSVLNGASIVLVGLMRGPAIINKNTLPANDVNGNALTIATLVTALNGLNPSIKANPELSNAVTQST